MPFEILSDEQIALITGKKRKTAQAAWFRQTFNIEPVLRFDGGVVMTQETFEKLMQKRLGVETRQAAVPEEVRPPIYALSDRRKRK